jgi:4-amino-4-deoxy-L-arabinose transferase-like glycosyltransferase/membrane-associated phospholipid phosphatase
MRWLQELDSRAFGFINGQLSNPVLDRIMPLLSGNEFFVPVLVCLGLLVIWKGRVRGVICIAFALLVVALGDGYICNMLKHALERPRPFLTFPDAHVLIGRGKSGSMPSSHAANWFAATLVAFVYYPRSIRFMLPGALLVAFSRVYNGVHYPSDVAMGAVLGAGYAAAALWTAASLWSYVGAKWFPLWWRKMPSLLNPDLTLTEDSQPRSGSPHNELDQHWLRLGYVVVTIVFLIRLAYLASGMIQLTGDEAYQWLWSKHLALSYYSKPPLIAYTQFLGTRIWGDTAFGVRFFSPVISALLGLMIVRFFAREVNARAGFFLLLIVTSTPMLAAGGVLMTVDPLSVLFWTAAMFAGWRAIQPNSSSRPWIWVGVFMGLGFLSKYTQLFQLLCWAVFFVLWPPARKHLRRGGPWIALLINLLFTLPVLVWNQQHQWVTLNHLADNAKVAEKWTPTLKYFLQFIGAEAVLLNPVWFVAMIWAAIVFWRRARHDPRLLYFFSMGAPIFLCYALYSFHSHILENWIVPSVLPLFCMMVIYWDTQWRLEVVNLKLPLIIGLAVGMFAVVIAHQTELVGKMTGYYLPPKKDPLHRARGWKDVAGIAGEAREELLKEGKPVFIIAGHYRLAGEIAFYLPEQNPQDERGALVHYRTNPRPANQFYFWPGYENRKGENAIFIREMDREADKTPPLPMPLAEQFESITEIGMRNVYHRGKIVWRLQLFACRGLR